MNGTQLAAGYDDGTVIAWSYPSGKILFQTKKHRELVTKIKWNPFKQEVFITRHRVRIAVNSLFDSLDPHLFTLSNVYLKIELK